MEYASRYESPLGWITLTSDGEALTGLRFDGREHAPDAPEDGREERPLPVFETAKRWLDVYFSGRAPDFTPPLKRNATPFREAVRDVLLTVPYGQTVTYGEIAKRLAGRNGTRRTSARAVGGAVGHNPIWLIIPCHRVVGADGALTGYAGGIERKAELLKLEGADLPKRVVPESGTALRVPEREI